MRGSEEASSRNQAGKQASERESERANTHHMISQNTGPTKMSPAVRKYIPSGPISETDKQLWISFPAPISERQHNNLCS